MAILIIFNIRKGSKQWNQSNN